MADTAPAAPRAHWAALACVGVLLALDALVLAGVASVAPTSLLVVFGAFLMAPLLAVLPGLVARRRRAYVWALLGLIPQFLYAATEMIASSAHRTLAVVVGLAAVAALLALLMCLRTAPARTTHPVR